MKLSIRIVRNDHGGFTAFCPTLPGCMSRGSSKDQARERLDDAIKGYLAAVSNFVPETLLEEEAIEVQLATERPMNLKPQGIEVEVQARGFFLFC